ncbi:helix-turn-helix domain-containing protein [Sphingomonas oryzagri]
MPTYRYMADPGLPHAKLFGARIRARREQLGWTQGELFEKTGITNSYISHVERGLGNPSLDIMVNLCDVLGVRIADILADVGTPSA